MLFPAKTHPDQEDLGGVFLLNLTEKFVQRWRLGFASCDAPGRHTGPAS
jgi:hypothetical protein